MARAYFAAFNRRDGEAICDAWSDPVRVRIVGTYGKLMRAKGCAVISRAWIGYGEEAGTGGWTAARILAVGPVGVTGAAAEVPLTVRHIHESDGDPDVTARDVLHLVREDGTWRLAKPGLLWYAAVGAIQIPPTVLDAPAPAGAIAADSRLPAPSFACPAARSVGEPVGDVGAAASTGASAATRAPWLDVRAVALASAASATCATIRLAAPPRPDSTVTFTAQQPVGRDGSYREVNATLRVDGLGRGHVTTTGPIGRNPLLRLGRPPRRPPVRYGARGSVVSFSIPRAWLARAPFRWRVSVVSTQGDDPTVAHPVLGQDSVPSSSSEPLLDFQL